MSVVIEIGPGTKPTGGHVAVGIDPRHPINAPAQMAQFGRWRMNATDKPEEGFLYAPAMEIPDEFADVVWASHVLEHIPSGSERIDTFNEAWRVLKPGGEFQIRVPVIGFLYEYDYPRRVDTYEPWADPTHVSYWYFPQSLQYFCPKSGVAPDADYGILPWELVDWGVMTWEGYAVLRKVTQ